MRRQLGFAIPAIAAVVGALVGAPMLLDACEDEPDPALQGPSAVASGPDELSPKVEGILIGEERRCREDEQCQSGVCYYGSCQGLMILDQPWMRARALSALQDALSETPSQRAVVQRNLRVQLGRKRLDYAQRARAVAGLEALADSKGLLDNYDSLPEPTLEAASLALTRMGAREGVVHAVALTEANRLPVAVEAVRALGIGQHKSELPVLLSLLSDDVDHSLVRAAVDALADMKDLRSVRPLVAFLKRTPDHLVRRILQALSRITGASGQTTPADWSVWVADNSPPEAPDYTVRRSSSEEDIGLPEP